MTLTSALPASQGNALDRSGPPQAKATLSTPTYRQVCKDAITEHYGSLKCAAIELRVDASQLLKEWARGNFLRFDEYADEHAKAFVAQRLNAVFGRIADPKLRARQLLAEIDAKLNDLRGCIESLL